MTVREQIINILRKVGGALSGTVHDRLTEHDGVLSRIASQLDRVNAELADLSSKGQNLADSHATLLQTSIQTIESLQSRVAQISESLTSVAGSVLERIEQSSTRQNEMMQGLIGKIDASDAAASSQRSALQVRLDQIDEANGYRVGALAEKIDQSNAHQNEMTQALLARIDASDAVASSQRSALQARMDQIDEANGSRVGALAEKIDQSNAHQDEMTQALLAKIETSDSAASSQRSALQARMDRIDEAVSSSLASILDAFEQSYNRQTETLQTLLSKIDASDSAATAQQSILQARMEQLDESAGSRAGSVLEKIEQSYSGQNQEVQSVAAKIDALASAAGAERSILQSRLDQVGDAVDSRVGSILERIEQSYNLQNNFMQVVLARINSFASAQSQQETIEALDRLRGHISEQVDHLATTLENKVVQQVCFETSDYSLTNPEIGLISFLYSYLPARRAIDIGAHAGEFSEALLHAGYEVYAFEPAPVIYKQLVSRLAGRDGFHAFQSALGSSEGEMSLHSATDLTNSHVYCDTTVLNTLAPHGMPDGLEFTTSTPVRVRTLKSLHAEGLVPAEIGIVKIDTEGFDLEVIRGMEDYRYPVVAAEYWSETPFTQVGSLYTLQSLVAEMRRRGYLWHVVLFRLWGRDQIWHYCNHDRSVPNSWGNIFFFRDYSVFAQAQMWCSAVVPRIYFKLSPATSDVEPGTDIVQDA